jgi:hypothetical protein
VQSTRARQQHAAVAAGQAHGKAVKEERGEGRQEGYRAREARRLFKTSHRTQQRFKADLKALADYSIYH